jgi:hypothetical protein
MGNQNFKTISASYKTTLVQYTVDVDDHHYRPCYAKLINIIKQHGNVANTKLAQNKRGTNAALSLEEPA